jgi:hypothetical protein
MSRARDTARVVLTKADYALPVDTESGTTYTFTLANARQLVAATNAAAKTFTIPPQIDVAWEDNANIRVVNYGVGALTINGASGVTVTNTATTLEQFQSAVAVRTGENTWTLTVGWNGTTSNVPEGTNLYHTTDRVNGITSQNRWPLQMTEVVKTANHTLQAQDAAKVIAFDSSSNLTLTVPSTFILNFPIGTIIWVYRAGTGTVSFVGDEVEGTPTVIRNNANISAQFKTVLLRKRAVHEWVLCAWS